MISAKVTGARNPRRVARRVEREGSVSITATSPAALGALIGSAAAFAAVVGIAKAISGRLGDLDEAAMAALSARRAPAIVQAARAISAVAEPIPVALLLTACAARHAGGTTAGMMGLTVFGGAHARRLLSKAVARPRPPAEGWLSEPEGFSFPSKHTTLAALATGACARCMAPAGASTWLPPLLAAAAVGASRVYLGVHWPTDVLAAWLFAEGCLRLADVSTSALTRPR